MLAPHMGEEILPLLLNCLDISNANADNDTRLSAPFPASFWHFSSARFRKIRWKPLPKWRLSDVMSHHIGSKKTNIWRLLKWSYWVNRMKNAKWWEAERSTKSLPQTFDIYLMSDPNILKFWPFSKLNDNKIQSFESVKKQNICYIPAYKFHSSIFIFGCKKAENR